MTFYALAVSVCLAVWFLAMAGTSILGLPLSRIFRRAEIATAGMDMEMEKDRSPAAAADILFALRVLPLFLAFLFTVGFALPAFLRLEPHASGEMISAKLMVLAAAGALVLSAMMARGARMLWATAQVEKLWRAHARLETLIVAGKQVRFYSVDCPSPLLAVTGFFRARIFVSRDVLRLLSRGELQAAVAHEMDHVRRFDNLKQFVLNLTRLPRRLRGSHDSRWGQASEIAADAGSLARGASALDLASALVKIGSLQRGPISREPLAASHLVPDLPGSPLEARILRLQRVLEGDSCCHSKPTIAGGWRVIFMIALSVALYVAAVSTVLPAIHEALEFLVR